MSMKNLKNFQDFLDGNISKEKFIQKQYDDYYSKLFELAGYLKQTDIKEISISDNRVVFTTRSHGLHFICPEKDLRSSAIETLNFQDYEKADSKMMLNLISDGDTIFDIGANMGWYSILFSRLFRSSQIHSFEPVPNTFNVFAKNILLNNATNIIHNNFGLSDSIRDEKIFFYPEGSGNASLQNLSESDSAEEILCSFVTLDEYLSDNGCSVDFLKCDVEGAELLVFNGAESSLLKYQPIVFSEILRKWSKKFNYDPNDIFNKFRSMGYIVFTSRDGNLFEFIEMNEETTETNFFFLHPEKHSKLIDSYS